jgi:hypothetical protein
MIQDARADIVFILDRLPARHPVLVDKLCRILEGRRDRRQAGPVRHLRRRRPATDRRAVWIFVTRQRTR